MISFRPLIDVSSWSEEIRRPLQGHFEFRGNAEDSAIFGERRNRRVPEPNLSRLVVPTDQIPGYTVCHRYAQFEGLNSGRLAVDVDIKRKEVAIARGGLQF